MSHVVYFLAYVFFTFTLTVCSTSLKIILTKKVKIFLDQTLKSLKMFF